MRTRQYAETLAGDDRGLPIAGLGNAQQTRTYRGTTVAAALDGASVQACMMDAELACKLVRSARLFPAPVCLAFQIGSVSRIARCPA